MNQDRKIVGLGKQICILLWKNWILLKRNKLGTFVEIFVSILFVVVLLFLRFFVDSLKVSEQNSANAPVRNVIDYINTNTSRVLVLYYPNNALIMNTVQNAINLIKAQKPAFVAAVTAASSPNPSDLDPATTQLLVAFISFPASYSSLTVFPTNVEYTIHTQEGSFFQYNVGSNFLNRNDYLYSYSPEYYCTYTKFTTLYYTLFNPIKHAIDLKIIDSIAGTTLSATQVKTQPFYCPEYDLDSFKTRFSFFPIVIIQIAYIFTLIINLGNIITEKQTKMREYLKLMGVKWYSIWITWFIRSFTPYLILTVLFSLVSIIKLNPRLQDLGFTQKALFYTTNFFNGFSMFFVYSLQVTMFTLLLGQIFSKTFVAKTIAIILWLATMLNFYDGLPSSFVKYLFCIFPNLGLLFSFQVVFQYERSSVQFNFLKLYQNLFEDPLTLGGCLSAQLLWTLFYIPLTWYIERIFPGEYGAPLPFYFPFMLSYWRDPNKIKIADKDIEIGKIQTKQFGFETEPQGLSATIILQNLTKKFRRNFKEKTVVDDVCINFYQNQITGLLGHNGAGKTTTTFMLCGIYAPTSGDALIMGKSIRTNMNEIRSSLGFCPQHDILYDELTVAEHIDLIASIKGYKNKEIKEEIKTISKFVGLHNDLEKKSKQLSGGMKRRLSVAMALTGGSRVIILDEPTSGLDPYNRRSFWELIRKFKENRTIILTTHFMEEADALSDRIAIMNHGQVKCCGSPLFLKNTFGHGYLLTLAKNAARFDEQKFKNKLSSFLKAYNVTSNIAAEMQLSIPFDLNYKLPELLKEIESKKQDYGIDEYGISSPTIEEVFIKVGSIDANENKDQANVNTLSANKEESKMDLNTIKIDENSDIAQSFLNQTTNQSNEDNLKHAFADNLKMNDGIRFWLQQLFSLWLKRFKIFYRRFVLAGFILLLPMLLQAILSALIPSSTNLVNSIRGVVSSVGFYNLKISNYGAQTVPYYITGSASSALQSTVDSHFSTSNMPGVNLFQLSTDTVNSFVLDKRKESLIKNLISDYFVGMRLSYTGTPTSLTATVYSSAMAYHSSASMLNEIDNLLLKQITGDTLRTIKTFNSPIGASTSLTSSTNLLEILACVDSLPVSLLNFINSIIVAFMIAIMTMHVSRERHNGSKQLQLLSGTHYITYWLSNIFFDWPIHLFNIASLTIILKIVDQIKNDSTSETYAIAGDSTLGYFFLLLLASSLCWCSYAYIWSFFFKSDIICFVVLLLALGLAAFIDILMTFLQVLIVNGSGTMNAGARLIYVLRIMLALVFPSVTIKRGMYYLKVKSNSFCIEAVNLQLGESFAYNQNPASIREPGIGLMLIFCFIQFILSNLILFLMEYGPFARLRARRGKKKIEIAPQQLDSDVEAEANRIRSSDLNLLASKEPLVVHDLVKSFKKGKKEFLAVNNLAFGIPPKECFGFLGLNGAGKTTTFKILTGELKSTSGKAYVNGYDIETKMQEARRCLAFCPQFDYLPEYLTVRDTFKFCSGLRGLQSSSIKNVVDDLMTTFKLSEFGNTFVQNLSGGNKRKVSSALTFIGRPSLIFLDEPTTGVDPAARRYLWTIIKKARDYGLTIILTTHSMEECEALSTKLGIMVNGQFKCFGSVQQLKNKFGKGYTVILKCQPHVTNEQISQVEEFVLNKIKCAKLKDKQRETLYFQIEYDDQNEATNRQSIADIFSLIESNKESLHLENYALSQTSLEQVFLSFALEQKSQED